MCLQASLKNNLSCSITCALCCQSPPQSERGAEAPACPAVPVHTQTDTVSLNYTLSVDRRKLVLFPLSIVSVVTGTSVSLSVSWLTGDTVSYTDA